MTSRKSLAFTLIELLVVISIIALLIAILLPALGAARQAARNTQSLSNIKQLATATNAYTADNDGEFPYRIGNTMFSWSGKAGLQGGSTQGYFMLKPKERPLNEYLYGGSLSDEMETPITRSPSDNVAGAFGSAASSLYEATGSSYPANLGGNTDPWSYFGSSISGLVAGGTSGRDKYRNTLVNTIQIDNVRNTSEFVIIAEEGAFFHGWSYQSPRTAPQDRWWFHPEIPIWASGYTDGHASQIEVQPGETWGDDFRFSNAEPPATYTQP